LNKKIQNSKKLISETNAEISYINPSINQKDEKLIINDFIEPPYIDDLSFDNIDISEEMTINKEKENCNYNTKNNETTNDNTINIDNNNENDIFSKMLDEDDEILFYDERLRKNEKMAMVNTWMTREKKDDIIRDFEEFKQRKKRNEYFKVDSIFNILKQDNVIKKEIQIVKQTDYIELIRIEYFTNFYSIEDIKNIYNNANYFPEDQINNENIKGFIDLEKDAESEVDDFCLLDDEGKKIKYYQINDDIIKRFKKGEKITIRFNDNETKEEEIKTIISYIIVNKKPFCNKYSFNIRFRQQIQEKKDNSFMVDSLRNNYILDRSYKVITIIQRKSLDSKFFDSDDIYGELKTSYISSDELSSFFADKKNFSDF